MLNVALDIPSLLDGMPISREQAKDFTKILVNQMTLAIHGKIFKAANQNLGRTRASYLSALQRPYFTDDGMNGFIALRGNVLAMMIEDGHPAFDEKIGFSKSNKRKMKKGGGWYLTVPFRWGTPNAGGFSEAFSGVMPQDVFDQFKGKQPSLSGVDEEGNTVKVWGGSLTKKNLENAFGSFKVGQRRAFSSRETGVSYEEYKHKSSIYEGIYKISKTYEKATQSTYISFRRVSDKSDPASWVHSGIDARKFFDEAIENIDLDTKMEETLVNYLGMI